MGTRWGTGQYSFLFGGDAQALDHILVNDAIRPRSTRMAYGRSNADLPESLRNDGTRPERLSDHDMSARFVSVGGRHGLADVHARGDEQ